MPVAFLQKNERNNYVTQIFNRNKALNRINGLYRYRLLDHGWYLNLNGSYLSTHKGTSTTPRYGNGGHWLSQWGYSYWSMPTIAELFSVADTGGGYRIDKSIESGSSLWNLRGDPNNTTTSTIIGNIRGNIEFVIDKPLLANIRTTNYLNGPDTAHLFYCTCHNSTIDVHVAHTVSIDARWNDDSEVIISMFGFVGNNNTVNLYLYNNATLDFKTQYRSTVNWFKNEYTIINLWDDFNTVDNMPNGTYVKSWVADGNRLVHNRLNIFKR